MPAVSGCTMPSECKTTCKSVSVACCERYGNEHVALPDLSTNPPCTTGMTDDSPSAQLGITGNSLLCCGTDLTAPPHIIVYTHIQGFSGRGNSSGLLLVDNGASYKSMSSSLTKSL